MRIPLLSLSFLLFLGLGIPAQPPPPQPVTIDPESSAKTFASLRVLQYQHSLAIPRDNEFLAQREKKARADALASLAGKKVKWTLEVEAVVKTASGPVVYPLPKVGSRPKRGEKLRDSTFFVGSPLAKRNFDSRLPSRPGAIGGFAISQADAETLRRGNMILIEGTTRLVEIKGKNIILLLEPSAPAVKAPSKPAP